MDIIADFFVDSLVVPVYFYIAFYGAVWIIALVCSRFIFMDSARSNVELAARCAWRTGFIFHLIGGTALIVWILIRAIPRVSEWWHVPFYLIFYILVVIVDIVAIAKSFDKKAT